MRSHLNQRFLAAMLVTGSAGSLAVAAPINIDMSGTTTITDISGMPGEDITPDPAPTWHLDVDFDAAPPWRASDLEANYQLDSLNWALTSQNPINPSEVLMESGSESSLVFFRGGPASPDSSCFSLTLYGNGITFLEFRENDPNFDLFPADINDLGSALFHLSDAFNDGSLFSAHGYEMSFTEYNLDRPGPGSLFYSTEFDSFTATPTPGAASVLGLAGLLAAHRRRSDGLSLG